MVLPAASQKFRYDESEAQTPIDVVFTFIFVGCDRSTVFVLYGGH
jgi:hypothetical protein